MNLMVKKLVNVDDEILNKTATWMYDWWGWKDGYSFDEMKCFMKYSMQQDKLPQTYGLFLDDEIIGMYQFQYFDLTIRPDIYPWLANVYIDSKYRKMGYSKILLEHIRETAIENIKFNQLYLYTEHIGLYEKYGFEYASDIDTYSETKRIQRLYRLDLLIKG